MLFNICVLCLILLNYHLLVNKGCLFLHWLCPAADISWLYIYWQTRK